MGNPVFQAMNPAQGPQGGPMAFIQRFPQFMRQMQGQDPNSLLQQMLGSGKINQQQLDQAQQMAKQLEGQMGQFKSMFGFR